MLKYWITCVFIITLKSSITSSNLLEIHKLNSNRETRKPVDRNDQQPRVVNQYQSKDTPLSINSPICQLRNRCYSDDLTPTAEDVRNCFCDAPCVAYGDCCRDYEPPFTSSPANQNTRLRDVAECRALSNLTATQAATADVHVWVINRCPQNYQDVFVRRRCEKNNTTSPTSDSFYRVPIFGRNSRLLYANVFCALCSGEENPVFWNVELRCSANATDAPGRTSSAFPPSGVPSINNLEDLNAFMYSGGCTVKFLQNLETALFGGTATRKKPSADDGSYLRRCTPNIDRCDRHWSNTKVDARCRQHTEYVYAGNRAFRNVDCARCNFVNETYLKCERTMIADDNVNAHSNFVENVYSSVVVRLDFEAREALIREQSGNDVVKESKMEFKFCGDAERSMYDPFSGKCRLLRCDRESSEEFHEGRCVKKVTMIRTGDGKRNNNVVIGGRSTERSVTSEPNDDDEDDYDDDDDLTTTAVKSVSSDPPVKVTKNIFSDPHPECERIYREDYVIVDDNDGTIFVKSRNVVLDRERYYFDKSHFLYVCPLPIDLDEDLNSTLTDPYEPMRLTIVHLNSPYQRLASIAGLVLSILCLLASVFANLVYPELRNSAFGKSFLSLMLTLLVAHSLYLTIQIVERFNPEQLTCFCLSAAAQFASLAAVLWLNVMSIIVFNAILRTYIVATATSTTLTERHVTSFPTSSSTGVTSYLFFSLYAWVVPLAVVALSVAVAAFGIDGGYDTDERVDGCWSLGLTQLLLLVVPVALALVANFAMYSVIFFRLCLRPVRVHTLSLGGGNSLSRPPTTFSHLEQQIKMTRQEQAMKEMKVHEKRYTVSFQLTVAMTLAWTFVVIATFTHWPLMSYLFVAFDTFLAVCVCFAALCNAKFCYLIGKRRQALRITDDSVRSHFETTTMTTGKYCMLDMDGTTAYLKDDKNNVVLRETSI